VLAANTRADRTRAMLFPVMRSHASMGAGVMAAVRRAKRSGTGVPPVRFPAATCGQRFRLPRLFSAQTPDLHPLFSALCLPASVVQNPCLHLPCAGFACFAVENPAQSGLISGKSGQIRP